MVLNDRIIAFAELGKFLNQFKSTGYENISSVQKNEMFFPKMVDQITNVEHHNGWFTKENVVHAFQQWSLALQKNTLEQWLTPYDIQEETPAKTIGVIMAGNIPLVGFHDFLCVLLSGHHIIVKLSSNDRQLLPFVASYLIEIEPRFKNRITFTAQKFDNFDAIIATGSNNTARYFEYYFGKVPHIIRKNRNSLAILTGEESPEKLTALGEDIFRYYGLGCRSVSKLFVPEGYDFDLLFKAMYPFHEIMNKAKYANNYDYNKAVYLMSNYKLLENGFLMLKEDPSYASPIATVFYETYASLEKLSQKLDQDQELIQCIVGPKTFKKSIDFGQTQSPKLTDYADGVDIIEFLLKIQ